MQPAGAPPLSVGSVVCCAARRHRLTMPDAAPPARSNRAAAHLKLGDASAALADVDAAVAAQTDWEKGHFRRGYALKLQGELAQVGVPLHAPASWQMA